MEQKQGKKTAKNVKSQNLEADFGVVFIKDRIGWMASDWPQQQVHPEEGGEEDKAGHRKAPSQFCWIVCTLFSAG
jgi:hypothetical protein